MNSQTEAMNQYLNLDLTIGDCLHVPKALFNGEPYIILKETGYRPEVKLDANLNQLGKVKPSTLRRLIVRPRKIKTVGAHGDIISIAS